MQKANQFKLKPTPKPLGAAPKPKRSETGQIAAKMTSPTLVEFKHQNSQLPEWRLHLQNAVQQRLKKGKNSAGPERAERSGETDGKSSKGTGERAGNASMPAAVAENAYLSNALKRIESSRNRYLIPQQPAARRKSSAEPARKDFPFTIASRTEKTQRPAGSKSTGSRKPTLVKKKEKPLPIKDLYDTSELDPEFTPAKLSSSFSARPVEKTESEKVPEPSGKGLAKERSEVRPLPGIENKDASNKEVELKSEAIEEVKVPTIEQPDAAPEEVGQASEDFEEYDDYAPLGLRFNAAMFDILIASFLSFILLVPFVFAGGNWFTLTGLAGFGATCAVVAFVYLTASVGFAGKTFGMHIFSLEMIDIGGESYPTFHQSAVSAAVFLVSLICLGIGFITALFDRDRRAAHDLLSRTLVIREL